MSLEAGAPQEADKFSQDLQAGAVSCAPGLVERLSLTWSDLCNTQQLLGRNGNNSGAAHGENTQLYD